jgi:hypothetical protein
LQQLKNDPTRVGWKNTVVTIVEDYMQIVDKTVHDLTPKFLNTFLVDKVRRKGKTMTRYRVVSVDDIEFFVEITGPIWRPQGQKTWPSICLVTWCGMQG